MDVFKMIIPEDKILINLEINNNFYGNLTLSDAEKLLKPYKTSLKNNLKPKETIMVPGSYMYFSCDENKNRFSCKIYKTSTGTDRWILFMMNDIEGYALYMNPVTKKMELAWYNTQLNEPLNKEDEQKQITCYVPDIL